MGDTYECIRPRWDVADGIASSDDGPDGRIFTSLESNLIAGFPDGDVGDTDVGTDGVCEQVSGST